MRLAYFAPADLQIARVDRQAIVHFCAALKEIGVDVELVALRIRTLESELSADNPLELYRIRTPFPLRAIRVPVHQDSPGWWTAAVRLCAYSVEALRIAWRSRGERLVVYTKNYLPALVFLALNRATLISAVVFEAHSLPKSPIQRFALRRASLVVANSHALAHDLAEKLRLVPSQVVGTHQGVDLELVDEQRVSRSDARTALGLAQDRRLVVYTGKIYRGYEEIEYIIEAALELLVDPSVLFVLVGGRADHVETWRREAAERGATNVVFTGFVAPTIAPLYQLAADVLVLYYPSGFEINAYRSPGKLFDYLAAERPIVSVDLPVLREILGDEPAALLVPQDAPPELAAAIREVLANEELAQTLAARGRGRAALFSWRNRAQTIVAALEERTRR